MANAIPRDVQDFIDFYPGQTDSNGRDNLHFYQNKLRCRPDDLLIEELLEQWNGQYNILERKHGYIQWLFPIREYGMNYESQPLQPGEITVMKQDAHVKSRLIRSYRLLLDFYGMQLDDEASGQLSRNASYRQRFRNLEQSAHNFLRISRILKCLGEFGFNKYPAAFILFVLSEQSEHNNLDNSYLKSSMDKWWANANRNKVERETVQAIVRRVRQGDSFTAKDYHHFLRQGEAGNNSSPPLDTSTDLHGAS